MILKYFISLILFVTVLFSCNPDKNRVVDRNKPVFKTNDASRLFFKNVRMLYYDVEERNEGKIQILRLGSRMEDSTEAIINVDIVNNWYQDRAYPMISLSSYFDDLENIRIKMSGPDDKNEVLEFERQSSMDRHFYIASAIYEGILKGYNFELINRKVPLFTNQEEKEAFRITMVDYYRLVAIY